jgi:hypothetical protein
MTVLAYARKDAKKDAKIVPPPPALPTDLQSLGANGGEIAAVGMRQPERVRTRATAGDSAASRIAKVQCSQRRQRADHIFG